MNEASSIPFAENEHVKELLVILRENNKDEKSMNNILEFVSSITNDLNKATEALNSTMRELNAVRDHPIKAAMQKESHRMRVSINGARAWLGKIKTKIIEGCKKIVTAFKRAGVSALDGFVKVFDIKADLESMRNNIEKNIISNQASITKIKVMSENYHAAGRHIKNIGRALRGKEPIEAIKPNGKLAKLIAMPYRSEIKHLNKALIKANKKLAFIDRLEKAAEKQKEEKPSTLENMKTLKAGIDQNKKDAPAAAKANRREQTEH